MKVILNDSFTTGRKSNTMTFNKVGSSLEEAEQAAALALLGLILAQQLIEARVRTQVDEVRVAAHLLEVFVARLKAA